jgi:quinolinate synthase
MQKGRDIAMVSPGDGMTSISQEIEALRQQWGKRLLILGHYYQTDEVLKHADSVGDSLELARRAAAEKDAERIVFCGVHFMAESACILAGPHQAVYMPDTRAGCPMADMAGESQVRAAWAALDGARNGWLPVVYVNSTAGVKALCGEWGGSTCTSANAAKILQWVFSQGRRVLFIPDQFLARNTAHDMGISDDRVALYDPYREGGGLSKSELDNAAVLAWNGFCHVHTAFNVEHVQQIRQRWPGAKIVVHPETPTRVLRLTDARGSTSQIIKYVDGLPDGTTVFIGTEAHLVERLAKKHEGRLTVRVLFRSVCPNMEKTTEEKLLFLLRDWREKNRIRVPADIAAHARTALERMLTL